MLATSCPYCISNFEESRLALGDDDPLEIKDITELISRKALLRKAPDGGRHDGRQDQLRGRHGGGWRHQRHPGRPGSRHVGLQGLPGGEGPDHRREDGPARQDLPHQRLLDVHRIAEVHRMRSAPEHRDPHLYGSRHGRGPGRGLRGHPDPEAQVRQRGRLHGLHDLCGVLPHPHPRSVQPEPVGEQGHPHLLRPGRSAGPLHRRRVPLPEGREVLHLRGRL